MMFWLREVTYSSVRSGRVLLQSVIVKLRFNLLTEVEPILEV